LQMSCGASLVSEITIRMIENLFGVCFLEKLNRESQTV